MDQLEYDQSIIIKFALIYLTIHRNNIAYIKDEAYQRISLG